MNLKKIIREEMDENDYREVYNYIMYRIEEDL
jgi:hypothetical protein